MKTYEGTFTIKWWKHDRGDVRAITIDCADKSELKEKTDKAKRAFMTIGEDGRLAHSVIFDLTERA